MGINIYDPSKALGDKITELDRKSLCELCSALCVQLKARAGFDGYCGGIYPSNISVGDDGNVAIGEGRRKDFSTEEVKFCSGRAKARPQRTCILSACCSTSRAAAERCRLTRTAPMQPRLSSAA